MSQLTDSLTAIAAAAAMLPRDSGTLAGLPEDELLAIPALFADITRQLEPSMAATAGEIARRSSFELGYAGLAQKSGFRTPEKLVQHLTGSTSREAAKLVRTGVIIHEAEIITEAERTGQSSPELTKPWLAPVGRAVAAGTLSIEAGEAIRLGLGLPTDDITVDVLAGAAARLVELATGSPDTADPDATDPDQTGADPLNADQLLERARALRDELDEAGIADREKARYQARSFKRYRRGDGMTVFTLTADPENAAYLDSIYDSLTSPRRGGPRMVDLAAKAREEAIEADPRSLEQLSFDGILAILHIGADTDGKTATRSVLGTRRPAVRVLTTKDTLDAVTADGDRKPGTDRTGDTGDTGDSGRRGHGRIEGQPAPVSIETVQRHLCESGMVPVTFDRDGQCIDLGREQRLYSARQRIGLAARDGGCRWPDCDRPPSWTEAHHINQWARDHGNTDLADGILLCRHHHMLLHNNHWNITRTGGTYWLHPPTSADPTQTPRLMPHKSAALADLQREQRRERIPLTG